MLDIYDFKPRAIIWELHYNGKSLVRVLSETCFGLLDCAFSDSDEANSDEVLRAGGFYDSTDTRSCINRKRI